MKTMTKLASALVLGLGVTAVLPAAAQAYGPPPPPGYGDHGYRPDRHDRYRHDRGRAYGRWDRRGPPPWARGRDYRSYGYSNVYVVPARHYRDYRLYAPRPGYRWVRDDRGNYLMVAIATGIIADVLLHH